MFEKDFRVAELIDTYGSLLSDRRREIIESYYYEDLSLSEISDNTGISRQGVRDSIKKSEAELKEFEEKLHFVSRIKRLNDDSSDLEKAVAEFNYALPSSLVDQINELIAEIRSI